LGNTLRSIAWEKSHIIKSGSVCVTGVSGSALGPIRQACRKSRVRMFVVKSCSEKIWKRWQPALKGNFQKANLALVLKTVEALRKKGWKIPERAVARGLKNVLWPGRFEIKKIKGKTLLLDGAHNPGAIKTLMDSLRSAVFLKKPCWLVFNAFKDKNILAMAADLIKNLTLKRILIPWLSNSRSSDPETTRKIFFAAGADLPMDTYPSVRDLWKTLKKMKIPRTDWILVSGSLHLVGETMETL
jgi:dihydrofolate synthase/folylpolyglutamate synthase